MIHLGGVVATHAPLMEQVFFRLHVRFMRAFCKVFPRPARRRLEYLSLFNAFACLAVTMWLHQLFVGPNQMHNCLDTQLSRMASINGSHPIGYFDEISVYQLRMHDDVKGSSMCRSTTGTSGETPDSDDLCQGSSTLPRDFYDRVYTFSKEKGLLMLPTAVREAKHITHIPVEINTSECFGGPAGGWVMRNIIGEDVVVMNWFLSSFGGQGHMYSSSSKEMYNLYYTPQSQASWRAKAIKDSAREMGPKKDNAVGDDSSSHVMGGLAKTLGTVSLVDKFVFKMGVTATTAFIFFAASTLVSFTLRETQHRMLKFTFLLQDRIRRSQAYASLIFTHVIESLVFVPIMMGMHFFLSATFSDQLIAFEVLSLVWLGEVYSVICVRSKTTMAFFPKFFWSYFAIFHLYFFSYPFGFSSMALLTDVLFIQHAMLYFWNRHEIEALHSGVVSVVRPRYNVDDPSENLITAVGVGSRTPLRGSRSRTQSLDAGTVNSEYMRPRSTSSSHERPTHRRVPSGSDSDAERRGNFEYMNDYYNRTLSSDVLGSLAEGDSASVVSTYERFNANVELSRRIQRAEVAALVGNINSSNNVVGGRDGRMASATLSHRYGYRNNHGTPSAPGAPSGATGGRRRAGSHSDGESESPQSRSSSGRGLQPPPLFAQRSQRLAPARSSMPPSSEFRNRTQTPDHLRDRDFPLFGVDLNSDSDTPGM